MIFTNKTMSCDEARALMFDYIDDSLSKSDKQALENHINTCADCKTELEKRKQMLDLVGKTEFAAPSELKASVMSKIAVTPQDGRILTSKKKIFIPWGTIAAACAVIAIMLVGRNQIGMLGSADVVGDADPAKALVQDLDNVIAIERTYDGEAYEPAGNHTSAAGHETVKENPTKPGEISFATSEAVDTTHSAETFMPDYIEHTIDMSAIDFVTIKIMAEKLDTGVLIMYESDFDLLSIEGTPEAFDFNGCPVKLYKITEDVQATFKTSISVLEDREINFRTVLPTDNKFDLFELWLIEEISESDPTDPDDIISETTKVTQ